MKDRWPHAVLVLWLGTLFSISGVLAVFVVEGDRMDLSGALGLGIVVLLALFLAAALRKWPPAIVGAIAVNSSVSFWENYSSYRTDGDSGSF